jgi:hypothetical protein
MKASSLSKHSVSSNIDRFSEAESDNDYFVASAPAPAAAEEDTDPEDNLIPTVEPIGSTQQSVSSNPLIRSKSAANSLSLSGNSRPRRSASLSDALSVLIPCFLFSVTNNIFRTRRLSTSG